MMGPGIRDRGSRRSDREGMRSEHATGDVEILVSEFKVLNAAQLPPFTIEDETDGGEDLRMKYTHLYIRRIR